MALSPKSRNIILWIITIIITLASVVYQRITGPTHPLRGSVEVGGEVVKFKLLRTHDTTSDAVIEFKIADQNVAGKMMWRRYKSYDEWQVDSLQRDGDTLIARVPKQPAAGKVMYKIELIDGNGKTHKISEAPVIIRFKGPVPGFVLLPHVLFMFIAMFLATRAGLEAVTNGGSAFKYTLLTTILMGIGGMILGPVVQKYAFGAFWTGWPIGQDLTDNKTLVAFIVWLIALWRAKQQGRGRGWIITAAVVQFLIYLIPHSVLGSEIDYTQQS